MDEQPDRKLKQSSEKAYNKIKLQLSIVDIVLNLVIIALLAFSGISPVVVGFITRFVSNDYLIYFFFITATGTIFSIMSFPFDFYGGYIIEHRFNLSNQSIPAWFIEKLKGAAVGIVIGVPVALVFYLFLKLTGWLWWLWFSLFIFFISVFLARIAPVIIFPIFYRFKELESDEIRERISALLEGQGIPIRL